MITNQPHFTNAVSQLNNYSQSAGASGSGAFTVTIQNKIYNIVTGKEEIMEIILSNIDTNDKRQLYKMTKKESQKIEGLEKGLSIPVDAYCLYDEVKERNKQGGGVETYNQRVLTFTSGSAKFGTISATFIKSFIECVEIMGSDPFAIVITGGTSKGGRQYVNCELDCDYIA